MTVDQKLLTMPGAARRLSDTHPGIEPGNQGEKMKDLKSLTIAAIAAMALTACFGVGSASATLIQKYTTPSANDTLGVGTQLDFSLESGSSFTTEDAFGFIAVTCTSSNLKVTVERVTPTGNPKGKITTLDFSPCAHTVEVESNGELEFKGIAGTTNATVFLIGAKVRVFNTILNQNCTINTGAGTDIGILTGAKSSTGKATLDLNGLMPLEGCAASSTRLTGKYEVTSPLGVTFEAS